MGAYVGRTLRRAGFLASAVSAAAIAQAAAAPWPRDEQACDAKLSDFDIDAPWHGTDESQDGNAGCASGHALNIGETQNAAHAFAASLISDTGGGLRKRYYKLIRTYKKKRGHGALGGMYGQKYLDILKTFAPQGKTLALDDIADIHLATLLILRRAVLALTAHDIDPDSFKSELAAEFRDKSYLLSFHFGPNDGSTVFFNGADMVDPAQP